ncbi:MAG: M15 family metallopeptidase [Oscillospiraceae bacterium]|jgi:D-alanyl-D-alanine carboxypeptidase|nr:M15 family metallopeptidase [Oscillospiraceae bacterium]
MKKLATIISLLLILTSCSDLDSRTLDHELAVTPNVSVEGTSPPIEDNEEVPLRSEAEGNDSPEAISSTSVDVATASTESGYSDLRLINKANPLPNGYDDKIELKEVQELYSMDSRCADYAIQMLSDAYDDGFTLSVTSAWRSVKRQTDNFNNSVFQYQQNGYSYTNAYTLTESEIAPPGSSEHNAGLALDIVNISWWTYHKILEEGFENTPEFKWLYNNCWKYGFILRYPKGKETITGYVYEPWHYRFVGVEHAEKIMKEGLTLEEYLAG